MRPIRSSRLLVVSVLVVALALSAAVAAFAAHPRSGKWAGKLSTNRAKVTFKVSKSGKRVKSFAVVSMPVYCYSQGYTTKVFLVPSAKVKGSGKFARAYKTKNDLGQVDGTLKVSGHFKTPRKASGKVNYTRAGCTSGPVKWSARRKR